MANKNLFNSIQLKKPNKNVFDLTHDVKLSLNMGELIPILALDCVPGDKISLSCESLLRFAPLIAPVMHRMDVTMHYFFVPYRILWKGWENWIINTEASVGTFPTLVWSSASGRLSDYLGLPTDLVGSRTINAMPFAAYQLIYNEYYRDQNLNPSGYWDPGKDGLQNGDNGDVTTNSELFNLRTRAWTHDYFTAALPWAQKGAPVNLPIGGDVTLKAFPYATQSQWRDTVDGGVSATGAMSATAGTTIIDGQPAQFDPNGTLELSSSDTTVNELRRAFRLQEWLEKNARAGTRYVESILAHFGVKSSDARLQRPEYITGTKSPVVISEILNTTGEQAGLPQGNMAGHGVSVTSGKYGSYFCEEHGIIIGVMSVLPQPTYQQGIPKHFLKTTDPFEYFWPEFAHIGEQAVQAQELYANASVPTSEFGYVPRYAEYKYMPSRVAGDFRTTLNYWHLGRIFTSEPVLNNEFIECHPGFRIFAVEDPGDVQTLYAHVLNKISAVRPMPKFGTPSF